MLTIRLKAQECHLHLFYVNVDQICLVNIVRVSLGTMSTLKALLDCYLSQLVDQGISRSHHVHFFVGLVCLVAQESDCLNWEYFSLTDRVQSCLDCNNLFVS
jgi:hypothetical protein